MPSGSCRRGPVMLAMAFGPHWQGTLQMKSLAAGTLPDQAQASLIRCFAHFPVCQHLLLAYAPLLVTSRSQRCMHACLPRPGM